MSVFGDYTPEDGYDSADPPARRLHVLKRVAAELELEDDPGRRADALRVARALAAEPGVDQLEMADVLDTLEAG